MHRGLVFVAPYDSELDALAVMQLDFLLDSNEPFAVGRFACLSQQLAPVVCFIPIEAGHSVAGLNSDCYGHDLES